MTVSTSIFGADLTSLALSKTYLGGDAHENEEPIHDDDTNIDADDWNKIVAGLAEVARRLRPGNIVGIPFELTGLGRAPRPQSSSTSRHPCGRAARAARWRAEQGAPGHLDSIPTGGRTSPRAVPRP